MLRFWFYLSPTLYSIDDVQEIAGTNPLIALWYQLNPFTHILGSYRVADLLRAAARLGGPRDRRPRLDRAPRARDPAVQAGRAAVREGPVGMPPPVAADRIAADRVAIRADDLGVKYNLRIGKKRTLRQTLVRRAKGKGDTDFWALRHVVVQGHPGRVAGGHRAQRRRQEHAAPGPRRDHHAVRGHGGGRRPRLLAAHAWRRVRRGAERASTTSGSPGRSWASTTRSSRSGCRASSSTPSSGSSSTCRSRRTRPGMRARLGFAIATSVEPDILLLDEVLATGDAAFREKSKQRVGELVREAKAIVLVTHDMNWVTEYCNRAMLIEKGGDRPGGRARRTSSRSTRSGPRSGAPSSRRRACSGPRRRRPRPPAGGSEPRVGSGPPAVAPSRAAADQPGDQPERRARTPGRRASRAAVRTSPSTLLGDHHEDGRRAASPSRSGR